MFVMLDYSRFKAVELFRHREAQEVRQKLSVSGNLVRPVLVPCAAKFPRNLCHLCDDLSALTQST